MRTLFVIIVLGALAFGTLYAFQSANGKGGEGGPDPATLFEARRGDLAILVTENGYLKAKKSVELKPKFRGEGLITWLVEEGSAVVEGDKLVEFDKKDTQANVDELASTIIELEVKLEASQAQLEIEKREADALIEKAELALTIAELELERFEESEAPNELRKLKLAKDKAETASKRAEEKFSRLPELAAEGFFTEAEVEEEGIAVKEANLAAETAELELKLYEDYTFVITQKQKSAALKDAQRVLANAKEKADISLKEKEANVTRQEAQIEASKSRLEKLRQDLDNMTMKAPQAGIVHYGDARSSWSRDRVKIGNRVYRGSTIITLPDLSEMEVLLKVHEADIDKVEEDQAVNITLDTYPGEVFTGRVSHIASVATSSGWDENTKAFRITVSMDPTEVELRAGISAKVEIEVANLEDVLHVPVHCVFVEEGDHFAFVFDGAEVLRRSVKVGQNNAHYVVVLEGLDEGERVLLYDPRDREAPAAVGTAGDDASTPAEAGAGMPSE